MVARLLGLLAFGLALLSPVCAFAGLSPSQTPVSAWQTSQWYRGGATLDLDFYNDQYWLNGTSYTGVANFITGAGATFTRAGANATYFDSSGVLQTASANAPRLDHDPSASPYPSKGILIEGSRTNGVTNNTMVGAVAGTPGTLPTNWTSNPGNGVSKSVIGIGTQNGVAYLDLRIYGTPTASAVLVLFMNTSNGIAASNGQTWTESLYVSVTSGSLTNIASTQLGWYLYDNTLAFLQSQQLSNIQPSLNATLTRFNSAGTISQPTVAFIQPYIFLQYINGSAIDVTIRIGMPQLELGAFPTSVIPTSGSTATRAADVFTVPTTAAGANGAWYTAGQGTLGTAAIIPYSNTGVLNNALSSINDGTSNNGIEAFVDTSEREAFNIWSGGSQIYVVSPASYTPGALAKFALAFISNNVRGVTDGASGGLSSSISIPSSTQLSVGRNRTGGSAYGWINRIWYMPTREPDSALADYTR